MAQDLTALGAEIARVLNGIGSPDGEARQTFFPDAEDGWVAGYSTERAQGGPFDGRFVVLAYRPVGRGSRIGKAEEWKRVYFKGFAKRKVAKARALAIYLKHSPKAAARAGYKGEPYWYAR